MFCPTCGRGMRGPAEPQAVPYPIYVCAADGVVYDLRRALWHGLGEVTGKLFCPACGQPMDSEPKTGPPTMYFCFQCGTTYDRGKDRWYGIAYHHPPGT